MKIDYKQTKSFVAEGDIGKALAQLAIETNGTDHSMEVTMLTSRHHRLSRDISRGILDNEDIRKEENQIIASILDLLERLELDFINNKIVPHYLQFFESPIDSLPGDDAVIEYATIFQKDKTRCVAFEMALFFPLLPYDFDIAFEWIILAEGEPIMAKQLVELTLPKEWDSITYKDLWGAEEFGVWEPATYKLEIYCKNKQIFGEDFKIV